MTNEATLLRRIEALERGRQFDCNYPMMMRPGYNRGDWNTSKESLWACDPRLALWVSVDNVDIHLRVFNEDDGSLAADNASLVAAVAAFHATRPDLPKVTDVHGIEKSVDYDVAHGFCVSAGLFRAFVRAHNVWEHIPHNRDRVGTEVSISASDAECHAGPLQDKNLYTWRLSIFKEDTKDIPL